MKTCNKCKIIKSSKEFDIERAVCKACRYEYKKTLPKLDNDVLVSEQKCSCCKITKPADDFMPERTRKTGLYPYCRPCALEKQKVKYQRQRKKYKKKSSERYYKVKHTEAHKAARRAYQKHKMDTDPFFVLTRRLRNRLYCALDAKSWKKNSKLSEYIGCDLKTLRDHIEKQFLPNMTWKNKYKWHLDHIIPLDSAETEAELYKLCHYTNIQPLWGRDNIVKGTKL